MTDWVERVRKIGWLAVEAAVVLVALCVLLDIILGSQGGGFVTSVAGNAKGFLQAIPPGTFLGVVIVVLLYWFVRSRK
ncbi:MAG: hypothetical protein EXQ86_09005 [Rhodospirillales bacterium]|nr:hypothetical protein [Rhodospirillales bacterium]